MAIYLIVFLGGWKLFESGDPILMEIGAALVLSIFFFAINEVLTMHEKKIKDLEEHIKKLEFLDAEAICDFIERSHEEYLKRKINVDEDIRHIVSLNHQVVEGIKQLTEKGRAHHLFRQGDG